MNCILQREHGTRKQLNTLTVVVLSCCLCCGSRHLRLENARSREKRTNNTNEYWTYREKTFRGRVGEAMRRAPATSRRRAAECRCRGARRGPRWRCATPHATSQCNAKSHLRVLYGYSVQCTLKDYTTVQYEYNTLLITYVMSGAVIFSSNKK